MARPEAVATPVREGSVPGTRATPSSRAGTWIALVVVVVAALVRWRSELVPVAYADDSSVHEQMVRFALGRFQAGHLPMTSWFPYLGLGSPQFLHYQGLPAMLTGVLGLATGGDFAFRVTLYLLVSLWPLTVYWSARLFDLGRGASVMSAAAAPLLMSAVGVGYEPKAYVWIGFGVWAQLWASWTLPLAWGFTWRAMTSRRAVLPAAGFVALTMALHFETGYLALIPIGIFPFLSSAQRRTRLMRAGTVGVGALLASAWVTVPLLMQGRWAATNEVLAHTPLVNGYGASQVMTWLLSGQLFDAHRLQVVTVLAGAGLLASVWRWRHDESGRALVALLVMSLLLSFGRTTFGGLTVVLPGSKDIFMRRFMMGVQLAGLYLVGVGMMAVVRLVRASAARWQPRLSSWATDPTRRIAMVSVAGVVGFAALSPAWGQIDAFASTNTQWVNAQHAAESTQGRDVDRLIRYVHAHGGGRTYAGMPSNWGSNFKVGAVPVFKYLESQDVDEVGYTLRTASLMTDPEYFFDEQVPGDYALFAVHYMILPVRHIAPVPARPVLTAGGYRLLVLPDAGYVRVVDTVGSLSADKTNVGTMSVPYLRSDLPGVGRYLSVAYAGGAPAPLTAPDVGALTGTAGRVTSEHDDLPDGLVRATVVARRRAAVVLSASFDPGWTVRVDGRQVRVDMVAPALPAVRVGPGVHTITFSYGGFGLYDPLVGLLVLTVIVLVVVGPLDGWDRIRGRRRRGSTPGPVSSARRLTATALLGAVHGVVGLRQEIGRDDVGIAGEGQTDTDPHAQLHAVDGHGDVEGGLDPARHGTRPVLVDGLAEDHELIATEMRGGVGGPDDGLDAAGRLHEDFVSYAVAQPVVDALEPVHVAEKHAQGPRLPAVPRQSLLQPVVQQVTVGETGHRIMGGPVGHL